MLKSAVYRLVATVCLISNAFHQGSGFPFGPPTSVCMTMFPKHNQDLVWQFNGPCPYKIKLNPPNYKPMQNITITIEADDNTTFRGVQLSVHRKNVNIEDFQGSFVSVPEEKMRVVTCMEGYHNTATHKTGTEVTKVALVWQAPNENVGDLVIRATFVKHYNKFWVGETADLPAFDQASIVQPAYVEAMPTIGMDDIDFSKCGSDKGCFLYPRHCHGADCTVALTYQKVGDSYKIEMMAKASGFVTMGLSTDRSMGNDNTITCTSQGTVVSVQNGYNPAHYNERVLTRNLTELKVRQIPGYIMCTFIRPRVTEVLQLSMDDPPKQTRLKYDMEERWHLLMAWGYVPFGTAVMGQHVELPITSDEDINFQLPQIHRGSMLKREIQAHGSLMVVAWILFTGLATVIARHYKPLMGGKEVCGKQVWFQTHRTLAIFVLLFTAASFVIIFVKLKGLIELKDGFGQAAGAHHAIMGITVGVAVLVQVFMGIIRPHPGTKFRPLFRWCHRFLGKSTHILAAITIMFAFNMRSTNKELKRYETITVGVWMGTQVLWELIFEMRACKKSASEAKASITDPKGMTVQEPQKAPSTRTDSILLFLYFVTLLAFATAVVTGIVLY